MKKLLIVLAGLVFMAGCGGGGGTGTAANGTAYNGVMTQATVTTANAKRLSIDAFTGGQVTSGVSGIAKQTTGDGNPTLLLPQVATLLEGAVKGGVDRHGPVAKNVSATAQNTIYGFSGSYSFSVEYNQVTGACSGTISFNQYQDTATSPMMNGPLSFTGVFNQSSDTFSTLAINIGGITGTTGGRSFALSGSTNLATVGSTRTVTMTVVMSDSATGHSYWINNYTTVLSGSSLTISGRYYDSVHGFVDVSTLTPLTASASDAMPTAGQMLFTGANGSKARLTFSATGYVVEVDAAGNGSYVVVP